MNFERGFIFLPQKESNILKEIDKLLTKGNYNEGLRITNEHIAKSNKEPSFQIELLLRKSRIHFYKANYTACLTLAYNSLKLSEKINDNLLVIDSLQIRGEVYNEMGHTYEVFSIIKQIELQLEPIQKKKGNAEQLRRAEYHKLNGHSQISKSEPCNAIANYKKSLAIFKQQNVNEKIAEVLTSLGYLLFMRGDKKGIPLILDAIKIQEKTL